MSDNYFDWQGTYSAIAFFSAHPGVLFGESAYPLTMLFTLGMLLFSTGLLCKTLIGERWLLPFAGMAILTVQFLPNVPNGFYWWNGAVYYTMFYSLMACSLAIKIKLIKDQDSGFLRKAVLIALLDFIIVGGNFITALLSLELNVCFMAFALYKAASAGELKSALKDRLSLAAAACMIFSVIGFLISILAPGNAMRQSMFGEPDAVQAVLKAVEAAYNSFSGLTNIFIIAILILSIPVFWKLSEKARHGFRFPVLIVIASFLLYASSYAPPLYAINFIGDGKILNVYYYLYLWFVFGNTYYLTGWVRRNLDVFSIIKKIRVSGAAFYAAASLLTIIALILVYPKSSFALCVNDLRSGEIQTFMDEYDHRLGLMLDDTQTDLLLEHFSAHPASLVCWEYGASEFDTRLYRVYYNKSSIIALPQKTAFARPNVMSIVFNGEETTVYSYLINDMNYIFLEDFYDLLGTEDASRVSDNRAYETESRRIIPPYKWELAHLSDCLITIDGTEHEILAYEVEGMLFHNFRNITELMGFRIQFEDGKILLIAPDNMS